MAATSGVATPIRAYQVLGAGTAVAQERRMLEKASQTFLQGTPVQVDVAGATGFIIACPTMNSAATAIIAGFSIEPGASLSTSGVAKTQNLTQKVPNQPSAVITPIGAPPNDGTTGFATAANGNLFVGTLGDSSDNTLAVIAQALIGGIFGLTKDAGNNFWYVDHNITTTDGGACVEIVDFAPNVTGTPVNPSATTIGTLNGLVVFRVLDASAQLNS